MINPTKIGYGLGVAVLLWYAFMAFIYFFYVPFSESLAESRSELQHSQSLLKGQVCSNAHLRWEVEEFCMNQEQRVGKGTWIPAIIQYLERHHSVCSTFGICKIFDTNVAGSLIGIMSLVSYFSTAIGVYVVCRILRRYIEVMFGWGMPKYAPFDRSDAFAPAPPLRRLA